MDQPSLFHQDSKESSKEDIHLLDGDLVYLSGWLSQAATIDHFESHPTSPFASYQYASNPASAPLSISQQLLPQLLEQTPWEQSDIVLYGQRVAIPRLNAWYGDSECHYQYSGTHFEPLPWTPLLLSIKDAVEHALADYLGDVRFNSALVNCYRDGNDSVAWHSDDEPELGEQPIVASLSLGGERVFQMRHKALASPSEQIPNRMRHRFILRDGDLLLMYGPTQHYWQHQIPKTKQVVDQRINITFRHIIY